MNNSIKVMFVTGLLGVGIFMGNLTVDAANATATCLSTHAGFCSAMGLSHVGVATRVDYASAKAALEAHYKKYAAVLGWSYMEHASGRTYYWTCVNTRIIKFVRDAVPVNGVCGTMHGRTYAYDASGWGSYSRCNTGAPSPKWPAFPDQGATTTWTCSGSGGGKQVSCWAKRALPPRIDGVCNLQASPVNTLDSKPTQSDSTLCSTGTATTITGNGSAGSPWTWSCIGSGPIHTDQTGCIAQMNPGRCHSTSPLSYTYPDSGWTGLETFCEFGIPVPNNPPIFPEIDINNPIVRTEPWRCNTLGGDSVVECSATNNPPSISCGVANNETEINTTPAPSSSLCSANATEINSPSLNSIGRWDWSCKYNGLNLTAGPCSAPSCLAGNLLHYSSSVYLKQDPNDQTVSVSVACSDPTPPKICCDIQAVDKTTGTTPTHVCTGEGSKEIVIPASDNYPAQCYFVNPTDPTCEQRGDCPNPVTKTLTISTMCAQKECNAQGSCQSTPIAASDLSECSSTCNSNADCSSGRIIETRP